MTVTFHAFLTALDAKRCGDSNQFTARCPAHDDRKPSLSITERDGRVLVHCFARCEQDTVIDELERRGLWPVETDLSKARQARIDQLAADLDLPPGLLQFDTKLIDPKNSVVDRYLWSRRIDVADLNDIRQHPKAWHKPTDTWWPCMVAGVRDINDRLRSMHRTWLSHLDPPQKAPVEPNRMLYGGARCAGCAIHLAPAGPVLLLGEGIESTASAMKLFGLPGWSAMSAKFLAIARLPDVVREVVIAADNDPPGLESAITAARRFRREGRKVRIIKPENYNDFNDLLLIRGLSIERHND